jgi:hypothetical protein
LSSRAGSQPRKIVIYQPSLGATSSRLEFDWKVDSPPLTWIFRVKDRDNYYAMGIRRVRPGPSPSFAVEHYAIYQGAEGPRAARFLVFAENPSVLQVRLEAAGQTFKLFLNDAAAETWNDQRLAAGGLGFLEQPGLPVEVQSVQMWFTQTGGA